MSILKINRAKDSLRRQNVRFKELPNRYAVRVGEYYYYLTTGLIWHPKEKYVMGTGVKKLKELLAMNLDFG